MTNVIKSLYKNSSAKVLYNGCVSEEFSPSQGVRQGSVLSPHLYNIYTEELLKDIEVNSKSGISLYGHYTEITMTDDIILMGTTLNGLQKLVDKCIVISKKTASASTRTKPNSVYQKVVIQIIQIII